MTASIFDVNSECIPEAGATSDDMTLVRDLRSGSETAYETLLARFQQPVYNLALRLLNNPSDASDAVQDVFLKVFRNIKHFRGQSSLKTWIYRIAVNEAHNQRRWFFRHCQKEVGLEENPEEFKRGADALPDTGRSPFDHVVDLEQRVMVEEALARINPTFREAVVLRDISDLSYEEVAEVLQVSLGTVKSRILRGREALREELTSRLEPQPALRWAPKPAEYEL